MKKYPSSINFEEKIDGLHVCYRDKLDAKYNLDIWAVSYLLNEGLYKEHKENIIHLDTIDVNKPIGLTIGLRLHFLSKFQFFKNIGFFIKNVDEIKEKVEDIQKNIGKNSEYITYSQDFTPRGTKLLPESLLEQYISENLSHVFETEFSGSNKFIRQFPANVFRKKISEKNRITRKLWIDILTVNKFNQLSVVELKAGSNCPLDLLIQAIDYGIYCHLFKEHLADSFLKNRNKGEIVKSKIVVYCVAEKFHPGLMGNNEIKGIVPLIRKNDLFDLILFEIKVKDDKVEGRPEIVYDSRRLE